MEMWQMNAAMNTQHQELLAQAQRLETPVLTVAEFDKYTQRFGGIYSVFMPDGICLLQTASIMGEPGSVCVVPVEIIADGDAMAKADREYSKVNAQFKATGVLQCLEDLSTVERRMLEFKNGSRIEWEPEEPPKGARDKEC